MSDQKSSQPAAKLSAFRSAFDVTRLVTGVRVSGSSGTLGAYVYDAFGDLLTLMRNPDELLDAQNQLLLAPAAAPAAPGTAPAVPFQWGNGALNRAAVVMILAVWEAYIERIAIEAVQGALPGLGATIGVAVVILGVAIVNLPRAERAVVDSAKMQS